MIRLALAVLLSLLAIAGGARAGQSPLIPLLWPNGLASPMTPYRSGTGGGGYTPPTLTNNYAIAYGDSRTANGGGTVYAGTGFTVNSGYGAGYSGFLFPLSNNKVLAENSWNFGVGAQSTAGIAGRVGNTGNDCNNPTATATAPCYTGARGTTTAVAAGATTASFTLTSGPAPQIGDYFVSGSVNSVQGGLISNVTGTAPYALTIPSFVSTGSGIGNGTVTATSPASKTSNFAAVNAGTYTFLGGSTPSGATVTDPNNNSSSTGAYSVKSDPAQVVFLLAGTNDGNLSGAPQSLSNLAYMLDQLGPAGANKYVILADEMPRGLAEGYSALNGAFNGNPEVVTVGAGPNTATVTNAANYYDTQAVFYAPSGTLGPPFVPGANDGVALTPVGAAPAAGQYSVSAGVYTFNAADAGKSIAIYYRWNNNGGNANLKTLHDGIAGLAATRPWVKIASTWAASADPSNPANCTTNCYPAPWVLYDGLHPAPAGGALVANAMVSAAQAFGVIQNTAPVAAPTSLAYSANLGTTFSSGAVTGACGTADDKRYYLGPTTPTPSNAIYAVGQYVSLNGTGSGLSNQARILCLDTTNNLIKLDPGTTGPATATVGESNSMVSADPTAMAPVGFTTANVNTSTAISGCGTANVNCGQAAGTSVKGYPTGLTLTLDAASQTAIGAGTLGFSYGMASNPFGNGFDYFVVQLQGYAPSSGSLSVSLTASTPAGIKAPPYLQQGDIHRAYCDVRIAAGPNGHLTNLTGVTIKTVDTSATTFNAPGVPASHSTFGTYTSWTGSQGVSSVAFSDGAIASGAPGVTAGVLDLPSLSPASQAGGSSASSLLFSAAVGMNNKDPVSATVYIGRCWLGKAAA